jgi:hypothetical protein
MPVYDRYDRMADFVPGVNQLVICDIPTVPIPDTEPTSWRNTCVTFFLPLPVIGSCRK